MYQSYVSSVLDLNQKWKSIREERDMNDENKREIEIKWDEK